MNLRVLRHRRLEIKSARRKSGNRYTDYSPKHYEGHKYPAYSALSFQHFTSRKRKGGNERENDKDDGGEAAVAPRKDRGENSRVMT